MRYRAQRIFQYLERFPIETRRRISVTEKKH
jgi:hypothetical protein